ncbi:MAG: hypothetical protein HW416_1745 [Chloroflexi bacterium]|nr:hypothetical protein [Chloroflexota bacterium]
MQEQNRGYYRHDSTQKYSLRAPQSMRARLMLEVASELAAVSAWPHKQPLIHMRAQGAEEWAFTLFGSDSAHVVHQVASGEVNFAIVNPGAILALAIRGLGPYTTPVPVRTIAVLPQFDQLGFAVNASTGLKTLTDVKEQRYPLKLSLRGQMDHSSLVIVNEIVKAHGFTLADIVSWGGQVRHDKGTPDVRMPFVKSGEVDAVWDEAMPMYAVEALDLGMRFLSFDDEHAKKVDAMGLKRVPLNKELYPQITETGVQTIDFSGWPVYTLASTSDEWVRFFCEALDTRKDKIPFYAPGPVSALGDGGLPLDRMCRDTMEGPLYAPLHPAAEAYWREKGYLT